MNSYKFDWKNTLTGTIELEAENGILAEEKLMNMTLKELLEKSKYVSDDMTFTVGVLLLMVRMRHMVPLLQALLIQEILLVQALLML